MGRLFLIFSILTFSAGVFAAGSAGGTGGDMPTRGVVQTPEQIAASLYKSGLKHKKRAWKNEERAAAALAAENEKKYQKYLKRAQKEYVKAMNDHGSALKVFPQHYEAANELGYALRKTGDYRKAIGAYNYALGIKPDFHQAIEYRGEAFLAIGLIEEAKQSYMILFRADPELAQQLMTAMDTWLTEQSEQTESVTELAAWVEERKNLANISQDLSQNTARQW